MNKLRILVALALGSLLVACQPTDEGEPAAESSQVTVQAVATALPPVVETSAPPAAATETFIPYIEAEATATPVPPTLMPTATPEPTASATPVPAASVSLVPVVTGGLTRPLYITHAGDARLFIVEQGGLVRIIEDGELLTAPFLDIRDRVGSISNEQGLLGLAFHPAYAVPGDPGQGVFFLNYTDKAGDTVVSQFRLADDSDAYRADPASEIVLLTQAQPYPNHNGGLLKFGPDDYLYIGLGDGGSAGDPLNSGQRLDTWLGKILRIDVSNTDGEYGIPTDNPFVDNNEALPEIWAFGVRNPWRFSFDRFTGDLFMGDVGQNQWEEINYSPAGNSGQNYGWKIMEANHCYETADCDQENLVLPIFEYDHSQGCSVTGGYVYRGVQSPALRGNYLFADYCLGTIWRLAPEAGGRWDPALLLDTDLVISSFGEDVNGELYVTDHARGGIYRLELGD